MRTNDKTWAAAVVAVLAWIGAAGCASMPSMPSLPSLQSESPTRPMPPRATEEGPRYTVLVADLNDDAGNYPRNDLGPAWREIVRNILHETGRFVVLADDEVRQRALEEQDAVASGRTVRTDKAATTGQMSVAQLLLTGSLMGVDYDDRTSDGSLSYGGVSVGRRNDSVEVEISLSLVDSSTGQVLMSTITTGVASTRGWSFGLNRVARAGLDTSKKANPRDALHDAGVQVAWWLVENLPALPWRGNVVLVRDGRVIVNRGAREGVRPGQVLLAGKSDVIRDPDTGEFLYEHVEEVARLRVDAVEEKVSTCSVTSGDARLVRRGLAVRLP